jgi:hypothetical protein
MSSEHECMDSEESPKGLYMIFAGEKDVMMGKVIGLTSTTALIHPWNFMFGGIDDEAIRGIVLADHKEFIPFDDLLDMDKYFAVHYWSDLTSKQPKAGVTNE